MNNTINAIRFLGLDAINEANSGHPGIVLGAAPMIHTLYTRFLKATPNRPDWFDRDRFVLSAGHGSALLYATLHLAGYDITMDDLKRFRQLHSNTPGHPEYGHTDGVETTTGPLGQGLSMAVGMAIAEAHLNARFNKPDLSLIDHHTYVLCGDGDLQEGVTQEAMSLAGHLGLGKLIVLYDSNDIQLDGPVDGANSENVREKYRAMNWHYMKVRDANNVAELEEAINVARGVTNQPSIIEVKSVIGFGSTKAGKSAAHGAPLGLEETETMREHMQYPFGRFEAPADAYEDFRIHTTERTDALVSAWDERMIRYQDQYPDDAKALTDIIEGHIDLDWDKVLPTIQVGTKEASRVSGGRTLQALGEACPAMLGGSADLASSTKAKGLNGDFSMTNPLGRNINFGVREHAMAAIVNGMVLHGLRAFSGGFFVFSDYMKPAMRMAAIMGIPSLYVFTHDSVAVGEDGPTHEPVEQLTMLRAMPNMHVYRPADANETNHVFRMAMERNDGPSAIVLTRQNLVTKVLSNWSDVKRGGYVISDVADFEGILIATGSEVSLALDVQEALKQEGTAVRVVSMPSMEVFEQQSKDYQDSVLPPKVTKRLALEMGATGLWYKYAANVKGIDTFGVSAPGDEAIRHFGFDVDTVKAHYRAL